MSAQRTCYARNFIRTFKNHFPRSEQAFTNDMIGDFSRRIRKSVAIKLTIWFLLLSLLPIATVILFIAPDVEKEFYEIEAISLKQRTDILALDFSTVGQEGIGPIIKNLTSDLQKAFISETLPGATPEASFRFGRVSDAWGIVCCADGF